MVLIPVKKISQKINIHSKSNIEVIKTMEKQKIAYLTIDDAPSPQMQMKMDFLLKKQIPAVWFCLGKNLEIYPEDALYAIKHGFTIGNHGYSHPNFSEITVEEIFEEILKTDELIHNLYSQAGIAEYPKIFRFPYLDKGVLTCDENLQPNTKLGKERHQKIQNYLQKLGYTLPKFPKIAYDYITKFRFREDLDWFVTYDVMEWSIFIEKPLFGIETLQDVLNRMEEDVPEEGRGLNNRKSEEIILLHDHTETEDFFIPIVNRLIEKGIKFKSPFK